MSGFDAALVGRERDRIVTTGIPELDLYLGTQIAEAAEVRLVETPDAAFVPEGEYAWVLAEREWIPPRLRQQVQARLAIDAEEASLQVEVSAAEPGEAPRE